MRGYVDSIAFEMEDGILAHIQKFGVLQIVKSSFYLDEPFLSEFVSSKGTKPAQKQLRELKSLYGYLAIVHTQRGLKYKLTRHKRAKKTTFTFQGLYQHTGNSDLMAEDLADFMGLFGGYVSLSRLDVAIEQSKPFNVAQIAKNLKRGRAFKYKSTTYLKTDKERKSNEYLNVKFYFKEASQKHRLEFVFKKNFLAVKDPDSKIEKLIKRATKQPFHFANFAPNKLIERNRPKIANKPTPSQHLNRV